MPPAPPPTSFGPLSGAHAEYRGIYKTTALNQVTKNVKLFLSDQTDNPGPQKPHRPDHTETKPQLCLGGGANRANAGCWFQVCQKKSCYRYQQPRFVTEPLPPAILSGLDALFAIQDEINAYIPRGVSVTQAAVPATPARAPITVQSSPLLPSSAPSSSQVASSSSTRRVATAIVSTPPSSQPSSSKRRLPPSSPTCVSPPKRRRIVDVLDVLEPSAPSIEPSVVSSVIIPPTPQAIDEAEIFDLTRPVLVFFLLQDHSQFEETLYPRHDGRLCLNDYKLLLGSQGFEQGLYIEYFSFATDEWTPCQWATRHLISGADQILQFRFA